MTTTNILNTDTYSQSFGGVVVSGINSKFSQNMYKAMVGAVIAETGEFESIGEGLHISESIRKREVLLECSSIHQMKSIIADIQSRFSFADNKYNSNPIDGSRQIPEIAGTFEYNGKGYIILFPRNSLTDETVPEKGVFKGVIIHPELYFSDNMQRQREETSEKARDIL